jgi:hypothetical protein
MKGRREAGNGHLFFVDSKSSVFAPRRVEKGWWCGDEEESWIGGGVPARTQGWRLLLRTDFEEGGCEGMVVLGSKDGAGGPGMDDAMVGVS